MKIRILIACAIMLLAAFPGQLAYANTSDPELQVLGVHGNNITISSYDTQLSISKKLRAAVCTSELLKKLGLPCKIRTCESGFVNTTVCLSTGTRDPRAVLKKVDRLFPQGMVPVPRRALWNSTPKPRIKPLVPTMGTTGVATPSGTAAISTIQSSPEPVEMRSAVATSTAPSNEEIPSGELGAVDPAESATATAVARKASLEGPLVPPPPLERAGEPSAGGGMEARAASPEVESLAAEAAAEGVATEGEVGLASFVPSLAAATDWARNFEWWYLLIGAFLIFAVTIWLLRRSIRDLISFWETWKLRSEHGLSQPALSPVSLSFLRSWWKKMSGMNWSSIPSNLREMMGRYLTWKQGVRERLFEFTRFAARDQQVSSSDERSRTKFAVSAELWISFTSWIRDIRTPRRKVEISIAAISGLRLKDAALGRSLEGNTFFLLELCEGGRTHLKCPFCEEKLDLYAWKDLDLQMHLARHLVDEATAVHCEAEASAPA